MQHPRHILSSKELREMLGADVMPLFRLLFAQMAASCAVLAFALREAASGKQVEAASPWQQPCTSLPLLVQRTGLATVPELSATLLHRQKSFESGSRHLPALQTYQRLIMSEWSWIPYKSLQWILYISVDAPFMTA
jgi:hypothetical protein